MIIEYLLFIGMGLYFFTALLFLYLFLRTLRTKDGVGLVFLKLLTFGLFVGSFTIFFIRFLSLFNSLDGDLGRAIAIINPLTLLGVGLYLNYLFHNPGPVPRSKTTENIIEIKKDVKEVKKDVKKVKQKIVK